MARRLIRAVSRLGRGYLFEVLRAKMLFTQGFHVTRRPAFARENRDMFYRMMVAEPEPLNYGSDLDEPIRRLAKLSLSQPGPVRGGHVTGVRVTGGYAWEFRVQAQNGNLTSPWAYVYVSAPKCSGLN